MLLADAASAHTVRWIRSLAHRGHDICLFSLRPPPPGIYEQIEHVHVTRADVDPALAAGAEGAFRKLAYLRALPQLRDTMRAWSPDIVHAHYASSYGLLATLARARPRIVSVWGLDVFSFPSRSPLHRWVMQWILTSADEVLSTSEIMKRQVGTLVSRSVTVTPFGIDLREFVPAGSTRTDHSLVVGTVKTLEPKYGIEYLLRAFARCTRDRHARPDWRLVIVGGGSLRPSLEALAHELGIASQVSFVGPCVAAEAANWHRSFDIAVYPSIDDSESFGVAAVESQACGVPVIVSRIGGLPEVVVDGVTGLVVPPADADALGRALLRLLSDGDSRRSMARAARRHVEQNFSLESCTDLMEAVYQRAARQRRARSLTQ